MNREYKVLSEGVYLRDDKGFRSLAPKGSTVFLTETKANALVGKVELISGIVIPPQAEPEADAKATPPPQAPKKK